MRVSCVIPVRDRAEMVGEAIASVYAQQCSDLEIIVVDDGSVDGTAELVARHYPEVKLVRLRGLGPGPARNAGVKVAAGEIIMFLDSDDLWLPDHVDRLLAALARGFEVAYGVALTTDLVANSTFLIPEAGKGREGEVLTDLLRWCFMVPSALAVSRKAFAACGGFRGHAFGEDWSFLLQLAARFPFAFVGEEVITKRRLHQGSLCCLADRQTIISFLARMHEELLAAEWSRPVMAARFAEIGRWVSQNKENWVTVQDWYLAMVKEGMI